MKLFSKKRKEAYKIAFCDTPDISTKFGEWPGTFNSYDEADLDIRMGWNKAIKQKKENAYQIDDGWLVIEKVS